MNYAMQYTGKLNATQIHLIYPDEPPIDPTQIENNGDISMAAVMLASRNVDIEPSPAPQPQQQHNKVVWDDALHQLAGRMFSMGFSRSQVRSTNPSSEIFRSV